MVRCLASSLVMPWAYREYLASAQLCTGGRSCRDLGVMTMKQGEKAIITTNAANAYGEAGFPAVSGHQPAPPLPLPELWRGSM